MVRRPDRFLGPARQMLERSRRIARLGADKTVGGLGYELVRKTYYSPIPNLAELPPGVWDRRSDLPGVRFDVAAGLQLIHGELAALLSEYQPPLHSGGDARTFHLENGFYGSVDAELLYAMVRRFAPSRVLELGSGMSTLVIADARARNHVAGWHVVCDPFPREDLPLRQLADVRALAATEVPLELFAELRAGDMLFVDTTHTVKIGGDVNRIILDALPRLAPGVFVHVHDIFLPWEYPRWFVEKQRFFWAEQYLLQAFLAFNDQYEVLCAAHALARTYPSEMKQLFRSMGPDARPSAFWLRRTGL